jgi:uncharacterized SAM-binding protein YcdF (DUF218 family)
MSPARGFRVLGLTGLVLTLSVAFTPFNDLADHWLAVPARLEPADGIVVLGSSVMSDGTLSGTSLRRAVHGIRLFRQGLAPLLIFLGDPGRDGGPTESAVRAALARDLGVPDPAILIATAQTTREEAEKTRVLLQGRDVRRILLVSEGRHLTRARALFERAGFEVLPAPSSGRPVSGRAEGRLDETRRLLGELLAHLYYRLAGYL